MKKILSVITAIILSFLMINVQSLDVDAASKKYVKSVSLTGNVTLSAGTEKTVKVKVKVKGKVSTKVKVKSSKTSVAKVKYSAKKKTITITGVNAGQAVVTTTSGEGGYENECRI